MTRNVLVARGACQKSEVYHLPSEDDPTRPKCDNHRWGETDYHRVDSGAFSNRRLCKQCSGSYVRNCQKGTQTATKLSRMDPDDLGGGVA